MTFWILQAFVAIHPCDKTSRHNSVYYFRHHWSNGLLITSCHYHSFSYILRMHFILKWIVFRLQKISFLVNKDISVSSEIMIFSLKFLSFPTSWNPQSKNPTVLKASVSLKYVILRSDKSSWWHLTNYTKKYYFELLNFNLSRICNNILIYVFLESSVFYIPVLKTIFSYFFTFSNAFLYQKGEPWITKQ